MHSKWMVRDCSGCWMPPQDGLQEQLNDRSPRPHCGGICISYTRCTFDLPIPRQKCSRTLAAKTKKMSSSIYHSDLRISLLSLIWVTLTLILVWAGVSLMICRQGTSPKSKPMDRYMNSKLPLGYSVPAIRYTYRCLHKELIQFRFLGHNRVYCQVPSSLQWLWDLCRSLLSQIQGMHQSPFIRVRAFVSCTPSCNNFISFLWYCKQRQSTRTLDRSKIFCDAEPVVPWGQYDAARTTPSRNKPTPQQNPQKSSASMYRIAALRVLRM